MRIPRRLQVLGLLAVMFPSLALGNDFNKTISSTDEQDTWQINKFENFVRYVTHGTVVHGHQFGFVMQPRKCEVNELWLTWSSYNSEAAKLVGSDVMLLIDVDDTEFKIRTNLETAQEFFPGSGMIIALFEGFIVVPEFIDLLSESKKIGITISGPGSQFFDLPHDEFSLAGFTVARQQAKKSCEERAI
jgi:hypothetical protein